MLTAKVFEVFVNINVSLLSQIVGLHGSMLTNVRGEGSFKFVVFFFFFNQGTFMGILQSRLLSDQ